MYALVKRLSPIVKYCSAISFLLILIHGFFSEDQELQSGYSDLKKFQPSVEISLPDLLKL